MTERTYTPDTPIGELGRQCRDCEYFDQGTAGKDGHSDCLNRRSPRFQTYANWTCGFFYPDTSTYTPEGMA